MTQVLMNCSRPNCPVTQKVLLVSGIIEHRKLLMTADEYLGHLTIFHGYDYNTARRVIGREAQS